VAYLKILRPKQWVKNLLLFVPLVFAAPSLEWLVANLPRVVIAFVSFSLLASAVYVFNDIHDLERDKLHPVKRKRPLPSGQVSVVGAIVLGLLSAVGSLLLGLRLGPTFLAVLALYALNNLLYSLVLKNWQLLDIFSIAFGFVLRVFAGAQAIDVPVSTYLFLTVFFLALFLAIGKRRYEVLLLGDEGSNHRSSLRHYSVYYLDQIMNISATLTLVVYTLYTLEGSHPMLVLTVPVVVFGLFRYYHITHNLQKGEPSDDLLSDPFILASAALYGLLVLSTFLLRRL